LDEEKLLPIVEGFAVGGVVGNKIARVEKDFKLRNEKETTVRKRECGLP
jgi:hypothetical protein